MFVHPALEPGPPERCHRTREAGEAIGAKAWARQLSRGAEEEGVEGEALREGLDFQREGMRGEGFGRVQSLELKLEAWVGGGAQSGL